MSETGVPNVNPLKFVSCGAPVVARPSDTVVKCEYCGSHMTMVSMRPPPPAPTAIIVETRHRHAHKHRLRRLLKSADFAFNEVETSSEGDRAEE